MNLRCHVLLRRGFAFCLTRALRHNSAFTGIYQEHLLKMKRNASSAAASSKAKKVREKEPDYHLTPSLKDDSGGIIWPAPQDQMERARDVILKCVQSKEKTLIVPDKDADGLTSGVILYKTLTLLGLPPELISVYLLEKGETVHSDVSRAAMSSYDPSYIFVLDIGSRKSPQLIDKPHTGIVIDHHFATLTDFPANAHFVNACHSPPVATSSLLTYEICKLLHDSVAETCAWLCAVGTHGDLGNSIKWETPFPDLSVTLKTHTKKAINDAVSLLNAPRRTATFDVRTAWEALMKCDGPKELLKDSRLLAARREINEEVERCTHTAPKFSYDAKVAVFRIESRAQVHPLIATRWANHLSSNKLEIVLVANFGYLSGMVNFSCRIARTARFNRDPPVDIIATLKSVAAAHPSGTLIERMGEDFAKGHVQASGGIVPVQEFEDLMSVLRIGEKPEVKEGEKTSPKKNNMPTQKNTLANYFTKK